MESTAPPAVGTYATVERIELDEHSWVDVTRGWISNADALFEALRDRTAWRTSRLWRYERWVEEPRLGAAFRREGLPLPVLRDAHRALQHRYGVEFSGVGLAYYRDGRDGQAFHRDRDMRWCENTVVAILSLGARRPWLLRPRGLPNRYDSPTAGAVHDLAPGSGDLLVMGGRCQADWEHSVPQVRGRQEVARISLQWRWTSGRGRPEVGASYRAARTFDG